MSDNRILFGLLGLGAALVYFQTRPTTTKTGAALSNSQLPGATSPAPGSPGAGPLFPVPNPDATADVPWGYMVYSVASDPDMQVYTYPDTNGFEHVVSGLTDVVYLTNTNSVAFNRRTGAITTSTTDHKPTLVPVGVRISLDGLGRTPKVLG